MEECTFGEYCNVLLQARMKQSETRRMCRNDKVFCDFEESLLPKQSNQTGKLVLNRQRDMFQEKGVHKNNKTASTDIFADYGHNVSDSSRSNKKNVRVFHKWTVMLNNRNELLVKGILKCGTVVRSKRVIQRMTARMVVSVTQHVYILYNHLVDDKHELPSFVRVKFYNGFPADWKYVHKLWKEFMVKGYKSIFCWPNVSTSSTSDEHDDLSDDLSDGITESTISVFGCSSATDNDENKSMHDMNMLSDQSLSEKRSGNIKLRDTNNIDTEFSDNLCAPKSDSSTEDIECLKITDISEAPEYGSAKNPKILTGWMPNVLDRKCYETEYGLIFEGNLLNEAGYIVQNHFATGFVLRRVSAKLIETVDREFFQLIGQIYDPSHVIPEHLLKHCRNGCPAVIYNFCKMWKRKSGNARNIRRELESKPVSDITVPVSKWGRKKLPLLSYWTGERVALKDDSPVYDPGNLDTSTLAAQNAIPTKDSDASSVGKRNTNSTTAKKQRKSHINDKSKLNRPNSAPKSNKSSKGNGRSANKKSSKKQVDAFGDTRKINTNNRKRAAQQLQFDSDELDGVIVEETENKQQYASEDILSSVKTRSMMKHSPEAGLSGTQPQASALKKRQRVDADTPTGFKADEHITMRSSIVRRYSNGITCTFLQSTLPQEDTFLDDTVASL